MSVREAVLAQRTCLILLVLDNLTPSPPRNFSHRIWTNPVTRSCWGWGHVPPCAPVATPLDCAAVTTCASLVSMQTHRQHLTNLSAIWANNSRSRITVWRWRAGWRRCTRLIRNTKSMGGSLLYKWGAACWKERFVILRLECTDGWRKNDQCRWSSGSRRLDSDDVA